MNIHCTLTALLSWRSRTATCVRTGPWLTQGGAWRPTATVVLLRAQHNARGGKRTSKKEKKKKRKKKPIPGQSSSTASAASCVRISWRVTATQEARRFCARPHTWCRVRCELHGNIVDGYFPRGKLRIVTVREVGRRVARITPSLAADDTQHVVTQCNGFQASSLQAATGGRYANEIGLRAYVRQRCAKGPPAYVSLKRLRGASGDGKWRLTDGDWRTRYGAIDAVGLNVISHKRLRLITQYFFHVAAETRLLHSTKKSVPVRSQASRI